jgi:hypothetical protein
MKPGDLVRPHSLKQRKRNPTALGLVIAIVPDEDNEPYRQTWVWIAGSGIIDGYEWEWETT